MLLLVTPFALVAQEDAMMAMEEKNMQMQMSANEVSFVNQLIVVWWVGDMRIGGEGRRGAKMYWWEGCCGGRRLGGEMGGRSCNAILFLTEADNIAQQIMAPGATSTQPQQPL